jgi:cell wall-associated NlpC family hydrolase
MCSESQIVFDDLIGRPYTACGKCYGLCRIAADRMGVDLPPWPDVAQEQVGAEIEKAKQLFEPVDEPQRGDLVHLVNFDGPPHVGIIIEPGVMLHATEKHGCHRIKLDNPWVKGRIEGVYRYVAGRK